MCTNVKRNILLNPGPATTTDSVKWAQVVPDICHREQEFLQMYRGIKEDLVKIVHGDPAQWEAVIFSGSGTLCEEICVSSLVPPGKKVCIINNGAYGQRMCDIAKYYNIPCVEIKEPLDQRPDLNNLKKALNEDKDIAVVIAVHHETTTGLLNDINEIGRMAKEAGVLFVADTISSYAGIPIDVNESQVDFLMATSNKCIQGMAGVGWVIGKREEIEKTGSYTPRSYYTNLYREYSYFKEKGETPFTPSIQVLYCLNQAIKEYWEEGEMGRWERYKENWSTLNKGLTDLGFTTLIKDKESSHLVTTVLYPKDSRFNYQKVHDYCFERGYTIYPGKIDQGDCFRVCNLGAITYEDIESFLVVFQGALESMGIEVPVQ